MGNEQQSGTSHHFMMTTSNERSRQQEKQLPSWTKPERISVTKPSWQIARDISMDLLSRKATRLSLKQDTRTNITTSSRSTIKNYHPPRTSVVFEPLKSYRVPRIPTEKETTQIAITYDTLCSFCDDTCISDYIRCRICIKTYHCQCLYQRGYSTNQLSRSSRPVKQEWSCPECSDLTRLLNQDELHYLINAFEQIDKNKDGYIILEEFLSLKSNKTDLDDLELFIQYNDQIGRKIFSILDTTQKGVVAWSDFSLFYSCKLIAVKDKTELTTKLTDKEIVLAKKIFFQDPKKTFDNEFNIIITREYFNRIYKDYILILKKKYGNGFLNAILDDIIEDKSEKLSIMNWSEFLRELSLFFLLNRSNDDVISNQLRRASIPAHLSKASVVVRSRFPSIEISSPRRLTLTRSTTPMIGTLISSDESFRKHGKILEKLNRKEEFIKKHINSMVNYTIVENVEEENNINLPKLKLNARDDRRTITDPWTSVKNIELLRNQPIFIKTIYK